MKRIIFLLLLLFCTISMCSCNSKTATKHNDIDPFENVEVTFYGKPNKGFSKIDISNCSDIIKNNFIFKCYKDGKISNGETVEIIAEYKNPNKKLEYNIKRTKKNYIVTGVNFYPNEIKNYEKDAINKSLRKLADEYISQNIENIHLDFYSGIDRNDWSKSGSFDYTYNYYDTKMIYNINKIEPSDNVYFIIYELTNRINCTKSMESIYKNPMKSGESDIGISYIAVGVKGVTANSNREFQSILTNSENSIIKTFDTKEDVEKYCIYGDNYFTYKENFV